MYIYNLIICINLGGNQAYIHQESCIAEWMTSYTMVILSMNQQHRVVLKSTTVESVLDICFLFNVQAFPRSIENSVEYVCCLG